MNLNSIIDLIVQYLGEKNHSEGDFEVKGYLLFSDQRLKRFAEITGNGKYHHSAMPLLDLSLRRPVAVVLTAGGVDGTLVARRIMLYHDSIWLMRSSVSVKESAKIQYRSLSRLILRHPTHTEKSENDVSSFLDELGHDGMPGFL